MIHPYLCGCRRGHHAGARCEGAEEAEEEQATTLADATDALLITRGRKDAAGPKARRMLRNALAYSNRSFALIRGSAPAATSIGGRAPIGCALPLRQRLFVNVSATRIQSCWRRYQAELDKEMKIFQQFQLQRTVRPFLWRRTMQRLAGCFFAWHRAAVLPRRLRGAIALQTIWRGHVARMDYAYFCGKIALLARMVRYRRLESKFFLWYCSARCKKRLREKKIALLRWHKVARARVLCRRIMVKMWHASRGARLQLAWRALWASTLRRRRLEWCARASVVLLRWRRFTRARQERNRRRVKKVCVYWRAWTALAANRRRRYWASTTIASNFRGWLFRTSAFRAARKVQCAVRQRLARNARRRHFSRRLFKNGFLAWKDAAPRWKLQRIKREKKRLYRAAVKRRMRRRAVKGLGSSLSPSFDDVLAAMEGVVKQKEESRRGKARKRSMPKGGRSRMV